MLLFRFMKEHVPNYFDLCDDCRQSGVCGFELEAQKIASLVKKQELDLLYAHEEIAQMRIEARKKRCPNLNQVDPLGDGL